MIIIIERKSLTCNTHTAYYNLFFLFVDSASVDILKKEQVPKAEKNARIISIDEEDLSEDILNVLGKQKDKLPVRGWKIHPDLAENIYHLYTPKFNPEAALAVAEGARKRDGVIYFSRSRFAAAIAVLSEALNEIIKSGSTAKSITDFFCLEIIYQKAQRTLGQSRKPTNKEK